MNCPTCGAHYEGFASLDAPDTEKAPPPNAVCVCTACAAVIVATTTGLQLASPAQRANLLRSRQVRALRRGVIHARRGD